MYIVHSLNSCLGKISGFQKLEVIDKYRWHNVVIENPRSDTHDWSYLQFYTTCEFHYFETYVVGLEYSASSNDYDRYKKFNLQPLSRFYISLVMMNKDLFLENKNHFLSPEAYISDKEENNYSTNGKLNFSDLLLNTSDVVGATLKDPFYSSERLKGYNHYIGKLFSKVDEKYVEQQIFNKEPDILHATSFFGYEKWAQRVYKAIKTNEVLKDILYNHKKLFQKSFHPISIHEELNKFLKSQYYPEWWHIYEPIQQIINEQIIPEENVGFSP